MKANEKRRFGRAGFEVTAMALGAAPIGNIFRPITNRDAEAMVDRAWDAGIRLFDTAPMYGHGLSEHRLGHALFKYERSDYILSTKVGRVLSPDNPEAIDSGVWVDIPPMRSDFDYTYGGVMRSVEASMQRLLTNYFDICLIHDCDVFTHGVEMQKMHFKTAMDGAYRALEELRAAGTVKAIGLGVNEADVCHAALRHGDFDCFLLAGRYTLLEQDGLNDFLPLCAERGVAIMIGGAFNSGILATGAVEGAKYNYEPAPEPILERVRRIEAVCARHNVPLAAAALQFILAHPVMASIPIGTRTVEQFERNLAVFDHPVPPELWTDLRQAGLLHDAAPVPA
jgi:D-threo-aldose 1-dehydrogenase